MAANWKADQPFIKNANVAKWTGAILMIAGAFVLYDAYEGRGDDKPFWTKLIPGL